MTQDQKTSWKIELDDVPFEADVRELLMAFYPDGAEVTVRAHSEDERFLFEIDFDKDNESTAFSCDVFDDRFETKCELKRKLYYALANHEGYELDWGTLTGIRPTKLILRELDAGRSEADVRRHFKETFFIGDEKIDLAMETALHERRVFEKIDYENGWSLYIGIPFCPSRCAYCSFTAYPISLWQNKKRAYIDALKKEIKAVSEIMRDKKLQTIYMGGGTPTSLEADELKEILTFVRQNNDYSNLLELTVEAGRPDSITEEKLLAIKECGATRISVNPQTLNEETLVRIGRKHTVQEFIEKFSLARKLGYDNINTDIIVGLPGEGIEEVESTMEGLKKLQPDDITVHSLAVKRAAVLEKITTDYRTTSRMLKTASKACRELDLRPYYLYRQKNMAGNFENVGYSHEGKEGIYNILIMEEKQTIVGCGAGCSTKIALGDKGVKRIENVKDPQIYIERIDEMIARKAELKNGTY